MKLIVGLGNPGREYDQSRHNVGFSVIDLLCQRWSIEAKRRRHQGLCGGGVYRDSRVVLLKPQTFMNRSGESVGQAVTFYKVALNDLLVISDDMALEFGRLRLRGSGSAGGHNGLKNIISHLGTNEFARLRVGIGQGRSSNAIGHVLGTFDNEEQEEMGAVLERTAGAVESWIDKGIEAAMSEYNQWLSE